MAKVSIIGAGFVGATLAHWLAIKNIEEIVLLDMAEGLAKGKALDLQQAMPIFGSSSKIFGTSDYKNTKNSDIIVITAGTARKPGMSRDELLEVNAGIVKECAEKSSRCSPGAIIIVVTNPLDAMVFVAWKASKFPSKRVIGMAGILDSSRMRSFIAEKLNASHLEINALVLGGHGDSMVPIMRLANVNGVPAAELLSQKILNQIIERTRDSGAEIVKLLQTGSAYYAPSCAVMQMIESILHDQKRVLSCASYLNGEYGVKGLFIGVPVVLGKSGVEKVIEIQLTSAEKRAFKKTAEHVRSLCKALSY